MKKIELEKIQFHSAPYISWLTRLNNWAHSYNEKEQISFLSAMDL